MRPGFPFMMMPVMGPAPEPQISNSAVPDTTVPERVRVAMQYLSLIHNKEMKRAVMSDNMGSPIELDGVPPTDEERITGVAACKMLADYFNGYYRFDVWEKQRQSAVQKKIDHNNNEGMIMPCPQCGLRMGLPCKLCKGGGKVILSSFLSDEIVASPDSPENPDGDQGGDGNTPNDPPSTRRSKRRPRSDE